MFRHGSLFSGIGGFDLAAEWMGWENVFQVEWDGYCQKVLAKNFPDSLRFGDIVEFNKMLENGKITTNTNISRNTQSEFQQTDISSKSDINNRRINLGHIDILTGGFPCQPFSHAGKRKGTDDSRYLWPEMLTTIRILKPSFVVGENVAGLISMENGKTLDRILSDLANEGYTTEQFIIPACATGAWHRRDRIWIFAYSINSTDRTNERKSRKEEIISCKCGEAGLSREFSGASSEILADTNNGRFKEQRLNKSIQQDVKWETKSIKPKRTSSCDGQEFKAGWWQFEPSVGRVANGIPNRVDRIKGLGNAIVPQVVYQIFKAIEEFALSENKD